MPRTSLQFAGFATAALFLAGCGGTQVSRIAHDSTVDLSGRWNDTDSRLVAEEMLRDALNARWYDDYELQDREPVVIVGSVRNRSHEHIDAQTFIKDMERTLINSGKVEFVANSAERDQIREERADQAQNAAVESQRAQAEESGAELMLLGSINSIVDREGSRQVIFYQVNLELVDIETNRKLWIGDKKIKKYLTRSSTRM